MRRLGPEARPRRRTKGGGTGQRPTDTERTGYINISTYVTLAATPPSPNPTPLRRGLAGVGPPRAAPARRRPNPPILFLLQGPMQRNRLPGTGTVCITPPARRNRHDARKDCSRAQTLAGRGVPISAGGRHTRTKRRVLWLLLSPPLLSFGRSSRAVAGAGERSG